MGLLTDIFVRFLIGFIVGNQFHERYHFWLGKAFGSKPKYSRGYYPIVTQTDFESPESLSSIQARIVSAVGYLSLLALIAICLIPEWPNSKPDYWVIGFIAGMAMISWLDGFGTIYPEQWKSFTAGDAISREDFQ